MQYPRPPGGSARCVPPLPTYYCNNTIRHIGVWPDSPIESKYLLQELRPSICGQKNQWRRRDVDHTKVNPERKLQPRSALRSGCVGDRERGRGRIAKQDKAEIRTERRARIRIEDGNES
ncbi:hypothetical protein EVAR_47100_1 [Eumeta japonica]|uniref:Uncharacterized protein n=1 Tax=Eumeta variegata TaxID=151549 RepID=A0A4C1YCG1_EUMVA|nr:hypothetical protein EVAR_47100_1 [Eumeta japonica]